MTRLPAWPQGHCEMRMQFSLWCLAGVGQVSSQSSSVLVALLFPDLWLGRTGFCQRVLAGFCSAPLRVYGSQRENPENIAMSFLKSWDPNQSSSFFPPFSVPLCLSVPWYPGILVVRGWMREERATPSWPEVQILCSYFRFPLLSLYTSFTQLFYPLYQQSLLLVISAGSHSRWFVICFVILDDEFAFNKGDSICGSLACVPPEKIYVWLCQTLNHFKIISQLGVSSTMPTRVGLWFWMISDDFFTFSHPKVQDRPISLVPSIACGEVFLTHPSIEDVPSGSFMWWVLTPPLILNGPKAFYAIPHVDFQIQTFL